MVQVRHSQWRRWSLRSRSQNNGGTRGQLWSVMHGVARGICSSVVHIPCNGMHHIVRSVKVNYRIRPPHAAKRHNISIHDTIITHIHLLILEAQEASAFSQRARTKINAIFRVRMKFVLAQLQRKQHSRETAKPKDVTYIWRGSRHLLPPRKPTERLNRDNIVYTNTEFDRVHYKFHRQVRVVHDHDDHPLQRLIETLNQSIHLVFVRNQRELNHIGVHRNRGKMFG